MPLPHRCETARRSHPYERTGARRDFQSSLHGSVPSLVKVWPWHSADDVLGGWNSPVGIDLPVVRFTQQPATWSLLCRGPKWLFRQGTACSRWYDHEWTELRVPKTGATESTSILGHKGSTVASIVSVMNSFLIRLFWIRVAAPLDSTP